MQLCRNCTHYSCTHQGDQLTLGPFGEYGYFDGWTEECLANQLIYFDTKAATACPLYKEAAGKCRLCEKPTLISQLRSLKGFCSNACFHTHVSHTKTTQKDYEKYVKEIIRANHAKDKDDIDDYL